MLLLLKVLFKVTALSTLALAIPTSVLEDLKDAQLRAPVRANKVKRAQEFIMFGNQQNRAPSTTFGNNRNEKRASEIDDNSLSEGPIPQVLPQPEEAAYENNHLNIGKSYPYSSRDLYYNMLLRNLELTQNLHNEPGFNYDYPAYSMMDGRYKRDVKNTKETHKPLYRIKREHALIPEELLAMMRMSDNDKDNKYYRDRSSIGWPVYESEVEDFPGVDEDNNSYEPDTSSDEGGTYNNVLQYGVGRNGFRANRPHKRFMVSKRKMGNDIAQYLPYGNYMPSDDIPLHRRYFL